MLDPAEWGYSRDTLAPVVRRLLTHGTGWWAFLSYEEKGEPTGVMTLNECSAIYALGAFGEISELYVAPAYRSAGVGAAFVEAAVRFGHERATFIRGVAALRFS